MYLPNRRMFLGAAAVVLAAAAIMAPTAAARPGGVIQTGRNGVTALGAWHVSKHPTFQSAVYALGAASAVHVHTRGNSCTGTGAWKGLGLRVLFTSFSADPYCARVRAQTGTISGASGRRHWQTARGLRVGDSLGKLKRLYPRAIRGHEGWAIVFSRHSVVAEGSRLDVVTAQVRGNRVSSFRLWIGGAGD